MDLLEKSAGDDASVSSVVSDEDYAEFLQFLLSPSPTDTKKVEPVVDAHDRELRDGPKVFIGSDVAPMEDSLVAATQEDEESSSFYVGPGEMGFNQGGSIHESDISETDSDAMKDNGSDDEGIESSEKDAGSRDELLAKRNAEVKLDDISVSSDEGYNEFLQFLMTPTVAISVKDDGSVTLSVSLKDKEVGSVTLSVKEEQPVVPSVDAGYEEFLLFLQSPEHGKKTDSLNAKKVASTSTDLDKLEDRSRSLSFESVEEAQTEGMSSTPNLTHEKAETRRDSLPVRERIEIKEYDLVDVALIESPSLDLTEVSEMKDTPPKKLITAAAIGSAVATKSKNEVTPSKHRENKTVKSITLEKSCQEPVSSVPASKLMSEDTLTAEFASAAAVGTVAAAVLISSEESSEVKPEIETGVNKDCTPSSPEPLSELLFQDNQCEGLLAATGVEAVSESRGIGTADEKNENRTCSSVSESREIAADEYVNTSKTEEPLSPNPCRSEVGSIIVLSPLSAISDIYFADTELREEDVAVSKIYFNGAELGEDDVIKSPVLKVTDSNLGHMESPSPSERTFSDFAEEESLNSLKSSELPDNQEELSKLQSPLAIIGKVEINEDFLKSLSSAGSFDEFFDCISQASNHSSIIDTIPAEMGLANNMSVKCGSPVISLEDFYECVSQMSLKTSQSESELSKFSRDESSEYIIKTFLLSLVFRLVQFKLESGIAEIAIWGHLYMRFVRSAK